MVWFCGLFCCLDIFTKFSSTEAIECAVHSSWNFFTELHDHGSKMPSTVTTKAIEYVSIKREVTSESIADSDRQPLENNAILDKICFSICEGFYRSIYRETDVPILLSITFQVVFWLHSFILVNFLGNDPILYFKDLTFRMLICQLTCNGTLR